MFREQTKFLEECNAFVRERKCLSEHKVSWGNAILLQENERKCFASKQSFLRNAMLLEENANYLLVNAIFLGEHNTFARERKCFVREYVFVGECCTFFEGMQYFCKRTQMFREWMQFFEGTQYFCKRTQMFHDLTKFLGGTQCFWKRTQIFCERMLSFLLGECSTFAREWKSFAIERKRFKI